MAKVGDVMLVVSLFLVTMLLYSMFGSAWFSHNHTNIGLWKGCKMDSGCDLYTKIMPSSEWLKVIKAFMVIGLVSSILNVLFIILAITSPGNVKPFISSIFSLVTVCL